MPKISTYGIKSPPVGTDMLVGTDTVSTPSNQTKNFTVQALSDFVSNGLQYISVTIQGVTVQQLVSNPYEILPAPGAGKAIAIYDLFIGMFPYATTNYNFNPSANSYVIDYLDPSTGVSAYKWYNNVNNFLNATSNRGTYFQNNETYNVFPTLENKKLVFRLEGAVNATQGDSPVKILMSYKIFSST